MVTWSFAKYATCGNDFILFDDLKQNFPLSPSLIKNLCHRQKGIGADGVLLLQSSSVADFCMRIFNADGSEAEMCGNGLCCFIQWLLDEGLQKQTYLIEVMQKVLKVEVSHQQICIDMNPPSHLQWNIPLNYQHQTFNVHFLNTGVPHAVLFMPHLEMSLLEFNALSAFIRHHPLWQPQGSNVNLVQILNHKEIKLRTYERGVEGETLACGTGATAAALAAAYCYQLSSPLLVETASGEYLKINFNRQKENFTEVTLTGQSNQIFQGTINLSKNSTE